MSDDLKKLLDLAKGTAAKSDLQIKKEAGQEAKESEIARFIRELNIRDGEQQVSNGRIYFVYCKWNPKRNRIKRNEFFRQFKKSFRSYGKTLERGYYLNPTSFYLPPEYQEEFNNEVRKRKIASTKKRNKMDVERYRKRKAEREKEKLAQEQSQKPQSEFSVSTESKT